MGASLRLCMPNALTTKLRMLSVGTYGVFSGVPTRLALSGAGRMCLSRLVMRLSCLVLARLVCVVLVRLGRLCYRLSRLLWCVWNVRQLLGCVLTVCGGVLQVLRVVFRCRLGRLWVTF